MNHATRLAFRSLVGAGLLLAGQTALAGGDCKGDCNYKGKIGDFVWLDCDGDGIQNDLDDAGQPSCAGGDGIPGLPVKLRKSGAAYNCTDGPFLSEKTTGEQGYYLFENLQPDTYRVCFPPPETVPSKICPDGAEYTKMDQGGPTVDSDADPDLGDPNVGRSPAIDLVGGQEILTIDAGFVCKKKKCDIELDKKCRVETPPVSGDLECEDKIAASVLEYTGPGMPSVTVTGKDKKSQVVSSFDPETGILNVDARPGDLGSKMTITTDGVAEVIHTSCSTPYVAGQPAPLDNPKGAPSPNWLVLSFVDKKGGSASVPGDGDGNGDFTDECSFVASQSPSCDTLKADKEKLSSLTFRYTGGGCPGDNDQGNKSSCSGSIDPTEGVAVQAGEKVDKLNYPLAPMFVEPDGEFTIDPDKFKSNSVLVASNTGRTETNELHTSCSQPLAVGDVFGSFTLVAMNGQPDPIEVTYQYVVTNNGDPLSNVFVSDDLLGPIGGPISLGTGESSDPFTKTVRIQGTTTNVGTAEDSVVKDCMASDSVTVEVGVPPVPKTCKDIKKITGVTMIWNGPDGIEATYNETGEPVTSDIINNGDVVEFETPKTDTKIDITGAVSGQSVFHVSCSDKDMDGTDDCRKPQGNGKKDDGGINQWLLQGMTGEKGSFTCSK